MPQATSSSVSQPQYSPLQQNSAPIQTSKRAKLLEMSQADLFANESPRHYSSTSKGIRSASSTNHLKALDASKPHATTLDGFYHWEKKVPNRVYMNQPLANGQVDQLTWGRFAQDVRKIAQYLNDLGLEKGSSVAIFSRNTAYFQIASMAINHAGMVSVPLHAEMKPDEINYALKDSDAKAIFIGKLDQSLVNNLKKAGLGEARLLLSGAGPISADITKRYVIGQGYGATENYANVTLDNPSQKIKHGTVGPLSKSVEYKLDNAQEKNGRSQGELLIKTKSLMRGYRNQPEKTAEVMTHDGFYKTGDLASVDKKGYVSILGRISNNFKTANGTFVNAGEIQQQIKEKAAPYIEDAFIFLDKKADKPAAALQLSPLGYLRLNPKSPEYDASLKEKVVGQLSTAITEFNASREKGEPKLSHVILAKQWTQDNDLLNINK